MSVEQANEIALLQRQFLPGTGENLVEGLFPITDPIDCHLTGSIFIIHFGDKDEVRVDPRVVRGQVAEAFELPLDLLNRGIVPPLYLESNCTGATSI